MNYFVLKYSLFAVLKQIGNTNIYKQGLLKKIINPTRTGEVLAKISKSDSSESELLSFLSFFDLAPLLFFI